MLEAGLFSDDDRVGPRREGQRIFTRHVLGTARVRLRRAWVGRAGAPEGQNRDSGRHGAKGQNGKGTHGLDFTAAAWKFEAKLRNLGAQSPARLPNPPLPAKIKG